MARNRTLKVDRSISSKFIFHKCCPGHDLFGHLAERHGRTSKARRDKIKMVHRMTRRIVRQNILRIAYDE